ncbi:MAG: hypothetical protein IPM18_08410 [Phycisphaerales bacterium]|nr:hypothetical protein [Phycisphaerales bacterium]
MFRFMIPAMAGALAMALLPGGCPARSVPVATIRLTSADTGRTIEVERWQRIRVRLSANTAAGLTWTLTELNQDVLEFQGREDARLGLSSNDELLQEENWYFRAIGLGSTPVRLLYTQGGDFTQPVNIFAITVVVVVGEE